MAILEDIKKSPVVRAYRQGWLAWLGAHKTAFEFAQDGAQKFKANREQLVKELIEKGEAVEVQAQDGVQKAKGFVEPRINDVREKVTTARGKVFARATDTATDANERFEALSGEIAKLSKTVSGLSRKVNTVRKPAAKKTAAKTTEAKAPVAKKTAEKVAA